MKKYKNVYLYKLGRYQQDFEYLFSKIKIKKYIVDDKTKIYNGLECIKIDDLKFEKNKINDLIIICERKDNKISKKFNDLGFIESRDYMYFEDFGTILDTPIRKKELKFIENFKKNHNIDLIEYHHNSKNSELLKKMIYTDSDHDIACKEPFRYAQVEVNGFVFPCCPAVFEEYMGNLFVDSLKNVWDSPRAKIIRLSIINKTYAFCNLQYCRLKDNENKDPKREIDIETSKIPEYLVISYDQSCNLRCKSCRDCNINYNNDKIHQKINKTITKKVLNSGWLNKTKQLVLATNGEVFFSKTYQDILFSNKLKNLNTIIVHTNATLLTERKLDKLCKQCKDKNIKCVIINTSVDSINKETYEKLRYGGNVDILKKNLQAISKARKEGIFYSINMIVVLQRDNYKELPEIAKFAIDLNFDRLDVQLIVNWGTFSNEEFKNISMIDEFGNPLPELVEVLKDPIFKSDKIEFAGSLFKSDKYMD